MNWKKAVGFGLVIWILMFVIVSVLMALKFYDQRWQHIAVAVVSGIISFVLAAKVAPASVAKALSYGLVWVVVGLILDFLVTKRYNPGIFSARSLWLGYALVLLAPLLRVKKSASASNIPPATPTV